MRILLGALGMAGLPILQEPTYPGVGNWPAGRRRHRARILSLNGLLWGLTIVSTSAAVYPNLPNEVNFSPIETRYVRLVVHTSSRGQPCLDELEVYGPTGEANLALASAGAKATALSCLAGHAIHQVAHLNDGLYGNGHSWIAAGEKEEWAQIELAGPAKVARIVFSRDRGGHLKDRTPCRFEVLCSNDGQSWQKVAAEDDFRRKPPQTRPSLGFDRLLFVKRYTYQSTHIYTDHYDGSNRMGGNLCLLSPVAWDGKVTEIAPALNGGIFGRFDLSFDARRVVFAYKKPGTGYRLYEIGVDGSGLRQLTQDVPGEQETVERFGHGYDDLDPCYLPNGNIMFASTRSRRAVLCTHNFTSTALHLMGADGGNLHCISGNTVNEFTPSVMEDGRVLYTRWEYVDKGVGDVQSLWAMHPDGSHPVAIYKNNIRRPATLIDGRSVPGSHQVVATGAPHMPLAVGPIILIDLLASQLSSAAMRNVTPEIDYPGHNGYANPDEGFYKEPYPLSDGRFIVSYNPGPDPADPTGYGLYRLDDAGHRELVYCDPDISCFQPMPLVPQRPPLALAPAQGDPAAPETDQGTLILTDVYAGLTGIARGAVKHIRVMEDVPKPWEASWVAPEHGDISGLQNPAVSLDGHYAIKKVLGVAPVAPDGSACFQVPSGKNLYFQALDENDMELQRMRTFVNLMPGECRSCIGCHESRHSAPSPKRVLALNNLSKDLVPQPGDTGPRMAHYTRDVQPTWDKHCVSCHGPTRQDGKLNLSGELTTLFNRSYEELIRQKLINHINIEPRDAYIPAEPPLTFGSHRSRLVEVLRKGHYQVKLTDVEFIRLVTWIDANAPYYGTYEGKRNLKWKDDPDFRPEPLACR